jgi:putative transposase
LAVLVLAADISDRDGAALLLELYRARYPLLCKIWGDSHYGGDLKAEAQEEYGIDIVVVSRPTEVAGFVALPKRWIVERSLAWWTRCRRLARDYEHDPGYSEAWLYVASIHRMLKYLAPDPTVPVPYRRKAA